MEKVRCHYLLMSRRVTSRIRLASSCDTYFSPWWSASRCHIFLVWTTLGAGGACEASCSSASFTIRDISAPPRLIASSFGVMPNSSLRVKSAPC
eukprot:749043-Hanusia_phi.AAC.2